MIYQRLVDRLAGELHFSSPALRAAYFAVPRHRFIPDVIWLEETDREGYVALSRSQDPHRWMQEVLADRYVITQVDDGRIMPTPGARGSVATCSASQPSIVFTMLAAAELRAEQKVLELGTGTGYNTGLLASVCGARSVASIECDRRLHVMARDNLGKLGLAPTLIHGDGAAGYAQGAPYDRLIATYAVTAVPYQWVEQIRTDGILVVPWGTAYFHGALWRGIRSADGSASGHFVAPVAFMSDRHQRSPQGPLREYVPRETEPEAAVSRTAINPWMVCDNPEAEFGIGAQLPDVQQRIFYAKDGSGEYTLWLVDGQGSWASVDFTPGAEDFEVNQYGPRQLWREVEAAYRHWWELGGPHRYRFGMTVTESEQYLWLDEPSGPRFPLNLPRPVGASGSARHSSGRPEPTGWPTGRGSPAG